MSDTNFSLLSQEEIDTLIEFLTDKSNCIDSEVLNQESIDKLIAMMRVYGKKPAGNRSVLETVRADQSVLNGAYNWTLEFEEEDSTKHMRIYATNGDVKEYITPRGYSCTCFVDDDSSWGFCISPVQFVEIAKDYNLKLSKSVYADVCERFAIKNYGSSAYDIDEFFLASGKDIVSCLLEG